MKNETRQSMQSIGKIIAITIAVYAGIRWLVPLTLPFLVAFLLAKLLNPLVERLDGRLHLKRTIWSSVLVAFFLALLGVLLFLFFQTLFSQIKNVTTNLHLYKEQAATFWEECCGQIENLTGLRAEQIQTGMEKQVPGLLEYMQSKFLPAVMNETILYAKNIFILVGVCFVIVISTILILKDYRKIRQALEGHPIGNLGLNVCRRTYEAGGAYLKSQIIIMFIITAICVGGLYFCGNDYALLTGCGIGFCDALPFLGTGTIFVPWALIEMLQGRYMLAAIYAVIYTVCSLMREVLEPKLLGDKLGMPPLTVVVSMYVGLGIYGLWGFALGPLSYILIKEIYLTT